MRVALILFLLPCAAFAEAFAPLPEFAQDGTTLDVVSVEQCIDDLLNTGPAGLVSDAAQACIGAAAAECRSALHNDGATTDDRFVACADLERSYWEWRIDQSFIGLAAWTKAHKTPGTWDMFLPLYENPTMATAHLTLECDVRVNRIGQSERPVLDEAMCRMKETALISMEAEFALRDACARDAIGDFAVYCAENLR